MPSYLDAQNAQIPNIHATLPKNLKEKRSIWQERYDATINEKRNENDRDKIQEEILYSHLKEKKLEVDAKKEKLDKHIELMKKGEDKCLEWEETVESLEKNIEEKKEEIGRLEESKRVCDAEVTGLGFFGVFS